MPGWAEFYLADRSRLHGWRDFLTGPGIALGATVVLAVLAAVDRGRLPIVLPAVLLGVSVTQLVTVFFNRPADDLTGLFSRKRSIACCWKAAASGSRSPATI